MVIVEYCLHVAPGVPSDFNYHRECNYIDHMKAEWPAKLKGPIAMIWAQVAYAVSL